MPANSARIRRMNVKFAIIATIFLTVMSVMAGAAVAAAGDDDFLAMRDAFRVKDKNKLQFYAQRLKGHVLEPYAAYWQLQAQLDEAEPQTVRAFLTEYKGTFVAERMRAAWLKRLGKEQQWALFEAESPALLEDDIEITCYGLQARARLDANAVREARSLWFTE